jgi:hypothetical protein
MKMLLTAVALATLVVPPAFAQLSAPRREAVLYAAQLYPYCARDSGSGATSCYFSSRAQCQASSGPGLCLDNPWYVGGRRRSAYRHLDWYR